MSHKVSKNIELLILGQKYTVKSNEDPEKLRKVALYVEDKLRSLVSSARPLSMNMLMVTALNIAHEYQQYREHSENVLDLVDSKVDSVLGLISLMFPSSSIDDHKIENIEQK